MHHGEKDNKEEEDKGKDRVGGGMWRMQRDAMGKMGRREGGGGGGG